MDATVMAMEPTAVGPRQIEFPIDSYTGDAAGLDVIGRAIDILQQQCFQRFGLDLPLPDREGERPPIPTWDWYGLWEEDTAMAYGYQSPPLGPLPFGATVPVEYLPVLGGEVETFNGEPVPDQGCQGESVRLLGIEDDSGLVSVDGLQRDAMNRARQHSEVVPLIADWSECLANEGWEVNDPADPFQHWQVAGADDGSRPSPDELEMATADIACKKETGLLRAWVAAEVAYQGILVEENADALRELAQWREEAAGRANEVIADVA